MPNQKITLKTVRSHLAQNWKSGLTVALVSLPLGIALSVASGASPTAGVITGIWAALIASLLGGSQFNIVGAAGALSTILAAFALTHGPEYLPLIALCAGAIMLLIYVFHIERYLIYIPHSVMYGFAAGVAVLIAVGQLNDALGLTGIERHAHFFANVQETFAHISTISLVSVGIFLGGIILLRLGKHFIPKFPTVILVAGIGIVLGYLFPEVVTLGDKFPTGVSSQLFLINDLSTWGNAFTKWPFIADLLRVSAVIALVAVLETLITAKLGDSMTGQKSDMRKELLALSMANVGSGVAGGLPATGVFIRTGLNIRSGATSRMSGIVSAITTGILAILFMTYFKYIPMAAIAAILFNVAIGLIEVKEFKFYWRHERRSFWVGIIVAILSLVEDPSIGIIIGVGVALLLFVSQISLGQFELLLNKNKRITHRVIGHDIRRISHDVDLAVYSFEGIMSYINAKSHYDHLVHLGRVKAIETIILRFRGVFYVDTDALIELQEAIEELEKRGKRVLISSINPGLLPEFTKYKFFVEYFKKNPPYEKAREALESIGFSQADIGHWAEHPKEHIA